MNDNLVTSILYEGQPFLDEPVRIYPKVKPTIQASVEAAFNPNGYLQNFKPITVRHERVKLRWMKPDGKGGLVPK